MTISASHFTLLSMRTLERTLGFFAPRRNISPSLLYIGGRVRGWLPPLNAKPHSEAVKMK